MHGGLDVRRVKQADRAVARAHLAADSRVNLFLIDLVDRIGEPPQPGEGSPEILAAWRGGDIAGLGCLRPTVLFDSRASDDALDALLPYFDTLDVGLVKSPIDVVDAFWQRAVRRGRRRALVDRTETAYCVTADRVRLDEPRDEDRVRPAGDGDLDALVSAARESLREEDRPDPFSGDPRGFRRWVRGRLPRARVIERDGHVVFVGYADVRLPEGWLLQGVYTWPDRRQQRFGTAGVSALCREAFAAGAEHIQLAVVDGNEPGRRLYERLGFEPFASLRTILFA